MKELRYNHILDDDYRRADEIGVGRNLLSTRIFTHGWDVERAVTTPRRPRAINYHLPIDGVTTKSYLDRLDNGWTDEQARIVPGNTYNAANKLLSIRDETAEVLELLRYARMPGERSARLAHEAFQRLDAMYGEQFTLYSTPEEKRELRA